MHRIITKLFGSILLSLVLMGGMSGLAQAVDGVVLINQARALAGNVTPGDAPGFPVTLSKPGSYRLAGNLMAGEDAANCQQAGSQAHPCAVDVITNNVTLDLNGFAIGSNELFPIPRGVVGAGYRNIEVINGTITNFVEEGIWFGSDSRVENVRLIVAGLVGAGQPIIIGDGCTVVGNTIADSVGAGPGIWVLGNSCLIANNTIVNNVGFGILVDGGGCTISGNTIDNNSEGFGIAVEGACTISGNTVTRNDQDGIRAGNGSVVLGNTVRDNSGFGIKAGDDCLVVNNVASGNGGDGINVGTGCTVKDNTANNNGGDGIEGVAAAGAGTFLENTAIRNAGDGIRAGAGSTVKHNTASQNGDDGIDAFAATLVLGNTATANTNFGLRLGGGVGYGHNVVTNNNSSNANPQVFSGIEIDTNVCGVDVTCP